MDYFAGLDVSVKDTSICIVGRVGSRGKWTGRHIALWRRDDAGNALRGGPGHAVTFGKMVVAQGLGDADCQTARDEKSDCRAGTPVGGDHASHLG
jgi:hypothetical protein